jgi:NAD-dependent deacetylase
MDFPPELISFLRTCRSAAALTGSGVSQESGIPTFREAQSGLWAQYDPQDLATPEAFLRHPKSVWDWYAARRLQVGEVSPNPGHTALAAMGRHLPHFALITQNVDGLHQQAGSPQVIELHGNIHRVKCFDCGAPAVTWEVAGGDVPHCPACGGLLRPDVVWFGEILPPAAMQAAVEAARTCQVFFSIGTSGLVHPAASLAYSVLRRGALVVEINAEPTPLTPHVSFCLQGRSGTILPALVGAVWG